MQASRALQRAGTPALMLMPGALLVYLSFNGGGFFPGATGVATATLAAALILRTTLADQPFAGFSPGVAVAGGALAMLACWTLLSEAWSDAPARALVEFDRLLLYLLALVLFGLVGRTAQRLRLLLWGVLAGIGAVCGAGFASRALADVWATAPGVVPERLSYPLTYWNALGLLAAAGLVLGLHFAASQREPPIARVVGSALLPLLGATLTLTFSRGATAVAMGGLLAYILLARPRALPSALLAAGPATAIAALLAQRADLLATGRFASAPGVEQGHDLAVAVLLCMLGGAAVRMAALALDARVAELRLGGRGTRLGVLSAGVAAAVTLALVSDAPGYVSRQYHRFVETDTVSAGVRSRFLDPGNSGRVDNWDVALRGFRKDPVRGGGAGTYQLLWERERPTPLRVSDAHSLYLETLAELGLVGGVLLALAVGTVLLGSALRARGGDRALNAAVFALAATWAVHAGVDWDWEMPALTLPVFAVGGLALARRPGPAPHPGSPGSLSRLGLALLIAALAATPVLMAVSQTRLEDSVEAFKRDDCETAIDRALAADSALAVRPEPFQILAFCDVRLRQHGLALLAAERAVELEPRSWELHYSLAVVRAAAGLDPRRAAWHARRLNPRGRLARAGVRRFDTGQRELWRRRARSAPLPFQ
jgi:hypothetical protein